MGSHRIVALAMALAAQLLAPVAVAQTPAEMQRMRNADAARRTAIQDENRRATQGAQRSLADTRRTTAEKGARQQAGQQRAQQQAAERTRKDAEASRNLTRERDQDRNRLRQQQAASKAKAKAPAQKKP